MEDFTKKELEELYWCINNSNLQLKYAKTRDSVNRKVLYLLIKTEILEFEIVNLKEDFIKSWFDYFYDYKNIRDSFKMVEAIMSEWNLATES